MDVHMLTCWFRACVGGVWYWLGHISCIVLVCEILCSPVQSSLGILIHTQVCWNIDESYK